MLTATVQPFFVTRYLGPTDHRGARIRASHLTSGKAVTLPYDQALSDEDNHAKAAIACHYACALGAPVSLVRALNRDGNGYTFTMAR